MITGKRITKFNFSLRIGKLFKIQVSVRFPLLVLVELCFVRLSGFFFDSSYENKS